MKKEMNLDDLYFKKIKKGTKTVELRLYDVKRKSLKENDIIVFNNRKTNEKIEVVIKGLERYQTFEEIINIYGDLTGVKNVNDLYNIYTKEEENKYGVLAIIFEKAI